MDPLVPSPAILSKLASIVVHAAEYISPGGHPFDSIALGGLVADPEIEEWIEAMRELALIPERRS